MIIFFIQEQLVLIYIVLMICSPVLNGHVHLFLTTLSSSKCCNYGIGVPSVSWRGSWELTAHSFMAIRLFIGLIVFTPGTLLNIYVLSIPVILEHWTDLSAAGWLLLLILGMGSQLISFYRERLVGGALY